MGAENYKVGDMVRVRKNLKPGRVYGGCGFIKSMQDSLNELATIKEIGIGYNGNYYKLDISPWCWTDEMLESCIQPAENNTDVVDDSKVVFDKNIDELINFLKV